MNRPPAYIPILLSEVEQEQRHSGNGDREAIVMGAGLCDGEGERAYTGYVPHIIRKVSASVFNLRRFGIFFFAETSAAMFLPKRPETSAMCIMLGGEDTHPWSATNLGNPILATIPVDQ